MDEPSVATEQRSERFQKAREASQKPSREVLSRLDFQRHFFKYFFGLGGIFLFWYSYKPGMAEFGGDVLFKIAALVCAAAILFLIWLDSD